jgi:hypothetical protein
MTHPKVTLALAGRVSPFPDTWSYSSASVTKNPVVELPSPYMTLYSQGTLGVHPGSLPP